MGKTTENKLKFECEDCGDIFYESQAKQAWDDEDYDDKNHLLCPYCNSSELNPTEEEVSDFYKNN